MKVNQGSALQSLQTNGGISGASARQYGQLGQMMSQFGSMDLGVLSVTRDVRQRSLSMQLVSNVLNQRNDDLKRIIDSLSGKA